MPFLNTTLEVFFDADANLSTEEMDRGIDYSERVRAACVPLLSGRGVTEVYFFGGKRGSGKTYAAGKLVEELWRRGLPVIVIDVVGNWWGLRVGADGDPRKGLKIPVIGGLHGDIDVLAEGGAAVAAMLVDTGSSAIIDLSSLRKGARQRFLTEWAEEFFHLKKADPSAVHVVLEEAHKIIPQRVMKGQERMLGAFEDLVRLGRNYGIGVSMLDQRPQSVNKEVLHQAEVMLAFQFTGAHERDAIRRWAEAKELPQGKEALAGLSSLPRGQCILWSPEWLKRCQKVDVGPKRTLDASATPGADGEVRAKKMLPIDLVALKEAMAKAAEPTRKAASASSTAVKARVERQQQDDHLDAVNAVEDASDVLRRPLRFAQVVLDTVGDHDLSQRDIEKLRTALGERERQLAELQKRMDVAEGDLAMVRDKWARALSQLTPIRTAHDELAKILQIGDLQVLGSPEVIDAPGHFANGTRGVKKGWNGELVLDKERFLETVVPTADLRATPGAGTLNVMLNPSSADATDDATIRIATAQRELAKFFTGTPDPEATAMIRTFLSVLYQRGPMNQAQILTRANYAKSGPTHKAFALMRSKGWVIAGNFGTGSTQLSLTGNGARAMGSFEPVELPTLTAMERAFLSALATRGTLTQRQILTQTGYSKSGPTNKVFAKFKRNTWVSGEDAGIAITDWGREVLGTFDKRVVGKAFAHALIGGREGKLSQMERSLLAVLWTKGSEGMTQKDALVDAQYAKSGPTNKAFAHLVALGYCRRTNGRIACSEDLYDHGD